MNYDGVMLDPEQPDGSSKLISGDQREVNEHVKQVYKHLGALFGMAVLGCMFQMRLGWMGMTLPFIGALASLGFVYLCSSAAIRVSAFLAFGFFDGWLLGPLLTLLHISPSLVLTALVVTSGIFGCFTASAMLAKRQSYLYLGGILGSCIWALLGCAVLALFFQFRILHAIQLYGGLVVFSLYVAYDTQVMIERAHLGNRDPLDDAINLFIDFMAIFRRVLIILAEAQRD